MSKIKKTEVMRLYIRKMKGDENKGSDRPAESSKGKPASNGVDKNSASEKEKLTARLKFYKTNGLGLPL